MDKYEKIRELKRENIKLKKYKNFVNKSKDTKEIYDKIKDLQEEFDKYQKCKKRCSDLLYENQTLQQTLLKLQQSELSFANKSNFYKQQMQINRLNENIEKLNHDYKQTFERNKDLEKVVEKLKDVFQLCDFEQS